MLQFTAEKLLIKIVLQWNITMKQIAMKKPYIRYFCRFVTYPLTLIQLKTEIFALQALFGSKKF